MLEEHKPNLKNSLKSALKETWPEIRLDLRELVIPGIVLFICTAIGFGISSLTPKPSPLPTVITNAVPRATSPVEIVRGDTSQKQVIFTFDGGGASTSAMTILDALKKHNVTATFFLTGKFVEANPDIVRRIHAEGHEIFSHTYSHPHLTGLSDDEIRTELAKMNDALEKTIGISARPFFRPPYGDRDERVRTVAAKFGFQDVYWTVDAMDWNESAGVTADMVRANILDNLAPGNIYLMHLGDNIMGQVIDDVLTSVQKAGYKVVSLTAGINPDQAQPVAPHATIPD